MNGATIEEKGGEGPPTDVEESGDEKQIASPPLSFLDSGQCVQS